MALRAYLAFFGSSVWIIEASNLADARTQVLERLNDKASIKGLVPIVADEVRVRPARTDEIADLLASV